jgi:hydroxymethylglutaryl-CoA lyase
MRSDGQYFADVKKERTMRERAYLREVGPRDGIQLVKQFLPTEQKLEWCRAEAKAGVREIEITSFVPASVVPQFADAADVARGALAIPGIEISGLVPNLKGAQRGFDLGVPMLNFVVSASEAHNLANVRRSTDDSISEFGKIIAERDGRGLKGKIRIAGGVATAFGCTLQGEVPEVRVVEVARRLAEAGADMIYLADTVGYGNPAQVRRLFTKVSNEVRPLKVGAHFHDTRGLGLANVTAALDVGVRHFDASLAGLGGCPFAPGATGNINAEDCAFLLESMGFYTGIDIDGLRDLRKRVESWLPGETFFGMVARAGLPRTYVRASASSAAMS